MEEIRELKERMERERPVEWDAFPDIGLYMDQVISYMPRQLIQYWDEEILTSAMVNNYIKDGMLPRAEGKRYSRTHLASLTAICALKQVLSVKDVSRLCRLGMEGRESQQVYGSFLRSLSAALDETAAGLDENVTEDDLAGLALHLALGSYARKLAFQRVLDLLQEKRGEGDKQKK